MEKLCNICPRNCNINREKQVGFCRASNKPKVSKVMLHYYEEPPISGEEETGTLKNGSGAIFFSSCNLKCVYCQNYDISDGGLGKEITVEKLADLFKQLEDAGANNINLVTPTHFAEQIIEALNIYRPKIPIVWNTSGYEKLETIKKLKDYVDIYLTDFKYMDKSLSKTLSNAENYPDICKNATLEMKKNQPKDIFENGLMKKGLIIRHLVLPTQTKNSLDVINWIYENLGNETYFSIMSQYTPMSKAKNMEGFNRQITPLEYKIAINKAKNLEFKNVFYQDLESANSIYTPNFKENDKKFNF